MNVGATTQGVFKVYAVFLYYKAIIIIATRLQFVAFCAKCIAALPAFVYLRNADACLCAPMIMLTGSTNERKLFGHSMLYSNGYTVLSMYQRKQVINPFFYWLDFRQRPLFERAELQ